MNQDTSMLPEWDKDLAERVQSFNEGLQPLLAKYELGIAAIVSVTLQGTLEGKPTVVSTRKAPEALTAVE